MITLYANSTMIVDSKLDGVADITIYYLINYSIGSKAYIIEEAKHGKLESIYIKKYFTHVESELYITYQDTLNRIWLEEELCDNQDASNYALSYWRHAQSEIGY